MKPAAVKSAIIALILAAPPSSALALINPSAQAERAVTGNSLAGVPFASRFGTGWPTTFYDKVSRQKVTYQFDPRRGGYIRGQDIRTGRQWRADVTADGAIRGHDLDGSDWIYSPETRTYTNITTGRSCGKTTILHVCPA